MADNDDFAFQSAIDEQISRLLHGIHLRRPSDYQSLFKFVTLNSPLSCEYLHRTLHDGELIGSAASNLNDPFELSPYIFDDLQPPAAAEARSYLNKVSESYRIIAFCGRMDSSLLWSHYANSYQGACLHFLSRGFYFHTLGQVSYSKYRPAYPLSLALASSLNTHTRHRLYRAESHNILFFTKAEDWAYETEVRLVYDCERHQAIKFNRDSLVAIILGPKFSDENRQKLDSIISGSLYENIVVRRARLARTTFSIEVDE